MGQLVSDVTNVINNKKSKSEAESKRQEILAEIAEDEKNKTNLVKKTLATQRAKYGSAGMSGNGITEETVLKRLQNETEEPYNEKKKTNLQKLKNVKANKTNLLKSLVDKFDELMG